VFKLIGMTRVILCCSGKGGVGKTTLSANLAVALAELGQDVIVVDGNLGTPDLGMHLGLTFAPNTIHDVIKRRKRLQSAIYPHPLGFRVIPGSLKFRDVLDVDFDALPEVTLNLLGRADFIIVDCSAGLGPNTLAGIRAADEVLLVTNPNLPAVTEALKTLKLINAEGKKVLGVVLNRVGKEGDLKKEQVEELLEAPVVAEIPEDVNVPRSIAVRKPVVAYRPRARAALEIRDLAYELCGEKPPERKGFWVSLVERLLRLFGR